LGYCSFYLYLKTAEPRNTIDVVNYLGKDWDDRKGGKTLLKQLIVEQKIKKSLKMG